MESGSDYPYHSLSSDQLREVEKTRNKLQQARQDISKQLLSERTVDCEVRTIPLGDIGDAFNEERRGEVRRRERSEKKRRGEERRERKGERIRWIDSNVGGKKAGEGEGKG